MLYKQIESLICIDSSLLEKSARRVYVNAFRFKDIRGNSVYACSWTLLKCMQLCDSQHVIRSLNKKLAIMSDPVETQPAMTFAELLF